MNENIEILLATLVCHFGERLKKPALKIAFKRKLMKTG